MPLYNVKCPECGETGTIFRKMINRDQELPLCKKGTQMERVLSAPQLIPEITPFQSPASQKWITSRSEWKEDLKRTGNIPYEKGMQEDIAKNKAHKLETAFKPIADAVDSKVAAMVASGKLEN